MLPLLVRAASRPDGEDLPALPVPESDDDVAALQLEALADSLLHEATRQAGEIRAMVPQLTTQAEGNGWALNVPDARAAAAERLRKDPRWGPGGSFLHVELARRIVRDSATRRRNDDRRHERAARLARAAAIASDRARLAVAHIVIRPGPVPDELDEWPELGGCPLACFASESDLMEATREQDEAWTGAATLQVGPLLAAEIAGWLRGDFPASEEAPPADPAESESVATRESFHDRNRRQNKERYARMRERSRAAFEASRRPESDTSESGPDPAPEIPEAADD